MQAELPEAERQWRGRAASAVLCLRSHCIPLPSLTQMVAWTTLRTPRANQELCPKYLLGRVFFFNPKYLFANFHTFGSCVVSSRTGNIKISWEKLSQTSEGMGIWCLTLNLGGNFRRTSESYSVARPGQTACARVLCSEQYFIPQEEI